MQLVLIIHNVRSTHNVGSLLRSAEGLGLDKVYLTGYTPYPKTPKDTRLPHLAQKIHNQIIKTALGAEKFINWQYEPSIETVIKKLQSDGFEVIALEQAADSTKLANFNPSDKTAIIVGREVEGIEPEVLALTDKTLEIEMYGHKESFNVAVAGAIALYQLKHKNDGHST